MEAATVDPAAGPEIPPLRDYSQPLVAARNKLDPLSHALATGDRQTARMLATEIRADIDKVIEWIDDERTPEKAGANAYEKLADGYVEVPYTSARDAAGLERVKRLTRARGAVGLEHVKPLTRARGAADLEPRDQPVCPHCGHVNEDAWAWNFTPKTLEGFNRLPLSSQCEAAFFCGSCMLLMLVERTITVTYTTRAPQPGETVSVSC